MSDFWLGFGFGSLVIAVTVSPVLTYFGMIYFNLRRMEKRLKEDAPKDIESKVDDETLKTLEEAEKLLKEHVV